MRITFILPASILALALCPAAAYAQARTYTNVDRGYVLDLPSTSWDVVQRSDGVHRHTDFFHVGDGGWRLRVRRELVDRGVTPAALADSDEYELRFLPGYVKNKTEQFAGRLAGIKLSYEYSDDGRLMAGRTYYLQAGDRIIYVLRFKGTRKSLTGVSGEADYIARSFRLR